MAGSSLLNDKGFGSIGSKRSAGKKNETGKLILAVGLLVVAGVVVAWSRGWILSGNAAPKADPAAQAQQQQQFEEQQKATQELVKQKKVETSGS